MAKNVVYILGAGFSAPFGIPVMRDFIDEARKIRRRGKKEFSYFDRVIKMVQDTVSAEKYFRHDSRNIEEAFSLLEMRDTLAGSNEKEELIRFIIDVVKTTTPASPEFRFADMPQNAWEAMFTKDTRWQGYCGFLASLAQLRFYEAKDHQLRGVGVESGKSDESYSIISMNYDLVLENVCNFLRDHYWWGQKPKIEFLRTAERVLGSQWPMLLKIHGSVDTGDIIPPSFNKLLYRASLPSSWREAYQCLVKANDIRVIGYSLPETDSYIKYLLMASMDEFRDLDVIDWIVRDQSGEVERRIKSFVTFKKVRFCKGETTRYLNNIFNYSVNTDPRHAPTIMFDKLELAHTDFMNQE